MHLTIVLVVLAMPLAYCDFKKCTNETDGWYLYNDNCYNFVQMTEPRTWHGAEHYCKSLNTHLVSIEYDDENDFITKAFENAEYIKDRIAWIGVSVVGQTSAFRWTDGAVFDYSNWAGGAPSKLNERMSCAIVMDTGDWKISSCDLMLNSFICKKRNAIVEPPTSPPDVKGNCPDYKWLKHRSKCYRFFSEDPTDEGAKDFSGAIGTCRKMRASVVSIHSKEEQDFLTMALGEFNSTVWIGLKKEERTNWVTHKWTDGTAENYVNWAVGQPSLYSGASELCVQMHHEINVAGQWSNAPCYKKQGFVCERTVDPKLPEPEQLETNCQPGYLRYRQSCFKTEKQKSSWTEAEKDCKLVKGNLVSITDPFDQAFLNLMVNKSTGSVWIGFSDAEEKSDGAFVWTNDWPVYYTNWDSNEPQGSNNTRRCVSLNENHRWAVTDCSTQLSYICRINDEMPPVVKKVIGACPKSNQTEWIDIGTNACYYVQHRTFGDWGYAVRTCGLLIEGGKLASFHNQHEIDMMRSYLVKTNTNFWIGLVQNEIGGYVWYDRSPADFVIWDKNQPTRSIIEACVLLNARSMKYSNSNCRYQTGLICEVQKNVTKTIQAVNPKRKPAKEPVPTTCSDLFEDWTYHNGHCYLFHKTILGDSTWDEAKSYCRQNGGDLTSIVSGKENRFISDTVTSMSDFHNVFWVGLANSTNGEYEWSDNSVFDFDGFVGGVEPSLVLHDQNCVSVGPDIKSKVSWVTDYCDLKQSFICKRKPPASEPNTTPSTRIKMAFQDPRPTKPAGLGVGAVTSIVIFTLLASVIIAGLGVLYFRRRTVFPRFYTNGMYEEVHKLDSEL